MPGAWRERETDICVSRKVGIILGLVRFAGFICGTCPHVIVACRYIHVKNSMVLRKEVVDPVDPWSFRSLV